MLITPPQLHMSFDELFNVGIFPKSTFGLPGTHGAMVMGIHGMGVKTPNAAAVAAATIGFAILMQVPNGKIFIKGLLSIMLAAGIGVKTRFVGKTTKLDGAAPNVHFRLAPIHT